MVSYVGHDQIVKDLKCQAQDFEICFINHRELLRFLDRGVT